SSDLVREIARVINIPFTVGGGISSVADVAPLLESGADKVSVNSSAVRRPELIDELVQAFGSQCIVLAIDARKMENLWTVHTRGGTEPSGKRLFSRAQEGQERGPGESQFPRMDHAGTKSGVANGALRQLHE